MKNIQGQQRQRNKACFALPFLAAALLCAVMLLAGCATDGVTATGGTGDASSQSAIVAQTDVNDVPRIKGGYDSNGMSDAGLSGKLDGAIETIDTNGIVHGTIDGIDYTVCGRNKAGVSADKVTLCAVGDQLATDNSLPIARAYAGGTGYDFAPFYKEVAPILQSYDLRYINQETVMNCDNGTLVSGYPVFNSPNNMAETIAGLNFNLVNFTTNHTYDEGMEGIEQSHIIWSRYPQLMIGGSYLTQKDRETVHMIERNGMTFAFLAYTYGDNSYADGVGEPNTYYACSFDKELMKADIDRAKKVADVVIVSMHWGTEYTVEPNDQEHEYAQWLADQDVDLVLGTHAHSIQPVRYIKGSSDNIVPVCFGLGDFVSGWTLTDTIVSGIFTCDFMRDTNGGVSVGDIVWYPTIEWSDGGDVYVRRLKDMTDAEIASNTRTEDVSDDVTHIRNLIDASGMEVKVDM